MVSVVMPEGRVRELMSRWGERLSVAAVNGPAATVVSGDPGALTEFEAALAARHVMRWRVPETDFVAHSAAVEELAGVLEAELAVIRPSAGRVRLYSTALGRWIDGTELDGGYWYDNVRQTVRFADAIAALAADGYRTYIEVSPHSTLETAIAETIEENQAGFVPVISGTLHRDFPAAVQVLSVLARAFARGVAVDWAAVLGGGRRVDLPTYAFQRQRLWPQARAVVIPAGGDGAGTPAEAWFWAAVEGGDARAVAEMVAVDGRQPFGEVLPALASWRREERDRSVTEAWRYRICWVPVAEPDRVALAGTWLMVTPAGMAGELVEGCRRVLESHGAAVVVAGIAMDDTERTGLSALLTQVLADPAGVGGVLSLLALDESPMAEYPVVSAGLAATLALVQALGDAEVGGRLWVLTRGAIAAEGSEVLASPVQGQVWGLGRVAGEEYRDRWGGLVDLPPVVRGARGGRPPRSQQQCWTSGPPRGCARCWPGAMRTRLRSGLRGSWREGLPGPRCPGPAAVGAGRDGADDRRERVAGQVRGQVAGRTGAAGGAGQPVRAGRGWCRRAGRGPGRRRDRGRSSGL